MSDEVTMPTWIDATRSIQYAKNPKNKVIHLTFLESTINISHIALGIHNGARVKSYLVTTGDLHKAYRICLCRYLGLPIEEET